MLLGIYSFSMLNPVLYYVVDATKMDILVKVKILQVIYYSTHCLGACAVVTPCQSCMHP